MKQLIGILLLGFAMQTQAATVNETLYIMRDSIQVAGGDKLPYLTFNETQMFSQTNARIVVNVGDDLDLWVVNLDSDVHDFEIKGETVVYTIPAGDSVNVLHTFNSAGAFVFHDPINFPDNASLGLASMIAVKDHNHASFYWNIKEHQTGWNAAILTGGSVDWSTYYPEFFTLNGNHNPNINNDPDARIVGNVGDTLMIYVTNTGQSIHPMHFHGYHVDVMYSSSHPEHVGRSKDTHGVYPSEGVVYRLIPHQPGEFPVHDHNLISTTGNMTYPMGMFTTILIQP